VKTYPALDVRTDSSDLLLAVVDDFSPVALEYRDAAVRVFFATSADRDAAQRSVVTQFDAAAIDVPDDDWARRSQADLKPIVVGRLTIAPSPRVPCPRTIVIEPSMGFGTGHHATTRLCLAALQAIDLDARELLDVGTGSGVLAIAAVRLGAARALGIDCDSDAVQSARENLTLNGSLPNVVFETTDLHAVPLPPADIVTANLTGALLARSAERLAAAVRRGGTLILSGILAHERDAVVAAFGLPVAWEREEDGWIGLAMKKS